jgi:LysM repeat protein
VSVIGKALCGASVALALLSATANAAVTHTVVPGETLWSIAAANNLTTDSLAAYNGLSADSQVYTGEAIQVPTASEATVTSASSGTSTAISTSSTGSTSHTVQPGESLSSVAAANGVSAATLAADNGLSPDALLTTGEQIAIPTATAPATSTSASTSPSSSVTGAPPPEEHPSWTSPIYCPSCPNGEAYLASNAAYNWNAMRQASLNTYGIDLYPAGPFSAYRSYAQQLYLYNEYLSGAGALAALPGSSAHEYGTAVDLADPSMRTVIDQIGVTYGWAKTEAPGEWWHVDYVGP